MHRYIRELRPQQGSGVVSLLWVLCTEGARGCGPRGIALGAIAPREMPRVPRNILSPRKDRLALSVIPGQEGFSWLVI